MDTRKFVCEDRYMGEEWEWDCRNERRNGWGRECDERSDGEV